MTALADAIARSFAITEPDRPVESPLRALGRRRLSGTEVLAQSVATTAPTASMVLLPVTMLTHQTLLAGLITIVIATVLISLIAWCVSQFTRRLAASGGLYTFVFQGMGTRAALTCGLAMLAKYLGSAALTMYHGGQAVLALSAQFGFDLHGMGTVVVYLTVALIILGALTRGVRFAAVAILAIEMCSLIFIVGLMLLVGSTGEVAVPQSATSAHGLLLVVLSAVFALAGFESATFFAPEARRPLITVTRAVQLTPVICGALLIFAGWAAYSGRADLIVNAYLHGSGSGVSPVVVVVLNAGLSCSWLASSMASSNAASRLIYTMSVEGVLPRVFTTVHRRLRTPYVALSVIVAVVLTAVMLFVVIGGIPADAKMSVRIALLIAYFLIAVAAVRFLRRIHELDLRTRAIGRIGAAATAATLGYLVLADTHNAGYAAAATAGTVIAAALIWHRYLLSAHPRRLDAVGIFDSPESADILPGAGVFAVNARGAVALVGANRAHNGAP